MGDPGECWAGAKSSPSRGMDVSGGFGPRPAAARNTSNVWRCGVPEKPSRGLFSGSVVVPAGAAGRAMVERVQTRIGSCAPCGAIRVPGGSAGVVCARSARAETERQITT